MPVSGDVLLGVGLAAIAALSVAATSLGVRVGTDRGRTTDALVVVLSCNLAFVLPVAAVASYPEYGIAPRAGLAFVAAGVTGTLLGRVCYFTSIARIGSSRTEPVKATQPLHATLIAVAVLGETVGATHLAGILLVVVGVAVITRETRDDAAGGRRTASGLLLAVGAAFFFGLEAVWARTGFVEGGTLLQGLAIRILAATVGFFGYLRVRGRLPAPSTIRRGDLRWYVVAGAANTLFLTAYYAALRVAPVSVVVPIVQTSPLVVICLSALFLPRRLERVSWVLVGGAGVVVAGAILITLGA